MLLNIIVIFYVLVIDVEQIYSLVELRSTGNDVLKTEAIIRNITNNLFATLKLTKINEKRKLKHYSMVYKNLVSVAQQDYKNMYEIFKTTKVVTDNVTNNFMDQLNALLNYDNKIENIESIAFNEQNVVTYIENFLGKFKDLKELYDVDKTYNKISKKFFKNLDDYNNVNKSQVQDYNSDNDTLTEENEFWVPEYSSRRIFRGSRTKIRHFPFMAVILFFGKFQCAGSIIKSDLVITAASCLQLAWNNRLFRENPAFISVRVGSNYYNGGGEVIPVIELYFHPSYNPKTLKHNLCILRLGRMLKFKKQSKRIKKIDFDRNDNNLPDTTEGVTVVGWGAKSVSNVVNDPWQNKISFAVLDFYGLGECQDIYSKEYVTNQHFCAGFMSRGGGACNRDVGGPGVVRGILMGVISFGSPVCGAADAPTVFTKLGFYADWIEEIMEQDVPRNYIRTTLKYTHDFLEDISTTERTTTFKLQPLSNVAMEKLSIFDSDQKVYNNYLKTMFDSEFDTLKYLGRDKETENQENLENIVSTTVSPAKSEFATSQSITEKIESITLSPKEPTGVNYNLTKVNSILTSVEEKHNDKEERKTKQKRKQVNQDKSQMIDISQSNEISDGDMVKILSTIDINEDKTVTLENNNHNIAKSNNQLSIKKMVNNKNDANNSVITLLYLSDNEKKDNKFKLNVAGEEVEEGFSIPVEPSSDITYRNNQTDTREDFYDILSKAELYDILNEAILSEVGANKKKSVK